jgi:hypothetical protein
MTDTTRELIQRMATELDLYRQLLRDDCTSTHPFADEARAYLAQSEPEGPMDEDLIRRLLLLAEQAVKEALDFEYGDPEDRYIWRELQELKQLVKETNGQT